MATSTVNPPLRSVFLSRFWVGLLLAAGVMSPAIDVSANTAAELNVLRVDVPLERASFRNGELKISSLIAENTYIDVEEFNLRAIELEASSTRDGEVRLKVGRYVTPPVPLPGPNNEGLLRIEAPHKSNKSWRLLIEDRIHITSLTAVLEPRDNNSAYYESRYESRGYTLSRDDNYRPYSRSRHDNWPYSWLSNNYDYNRRSAHWFWLNDSRSRFHYNSGYGNSHRHTPRCYDRYGRHMRFNSSFGSTRGLQRSRDFDRYRSTRGSRLPQPTDLPQPREPSPRLREHNRDQRNSDRSPIDRSDRNRTRGPVARTPDAPSIQDAQRNQAAQAQLQQRMQRAQARAQSRDSGQQAARQQEQERQQRRANSERRRSQPMGPRTQRADSSQRHPRTTLQRGDQRQRQKN